MRIKRRKAQGIEVPMSPLIDCVFLLLIFFLVTSMIKRWEHQVPVQLPDQTSSLSDQPQRSAVVIAVNRQGEYFRAAGLGEFGQVRFTPFPDLATMLQGVAAEQGLDVPLEIAAQRGTPFQTLLDAVDICRLQGFDKVSVRITTQLDDRRRR
ncbi:MAG: ExbD/TolR family protein [Phycisphaerae bacterium]